MVLPRHLSVRSVDICILGKRSVPLIWAMYCLTSPLRKLHSSTLVCRCVSCSSIFPIFVFVPLQSVHVHNVFLMEVTFLGSHFALVLASYSFLEPSPRLVSHLALQLACKLSVVSSLTPPGPPCVGSKSCICCLSACLCFSLVVISVAVPLEMLLATGQPTHVLLMSCLQDFR